MKKIISLAFMAFCLVAAIDAAKPKEVLDTLVVSTDPQMHCRSCEDRIMENIRFVKGTKKIATSVPKQTVTIVYDKNKASFNSYKAAFAKIGYTIKKK